MKTARVLVLLGLMGSAAIVPACDEPESIGQTIPAGGTAGTAPSGGASGSATGGTSGGRAGAGATSGGTAGSGTSGDGGVGGEAGDEAGGDGGQAGEGDSGEGGEGGAPTGGTGGMSGGSGSGGMVGSGGMGGAAGASGSSGAAGTGGASGASGASGAGMGGAGTGGAGMGGAGTGGAGGQTSALRFVATGETGRGNANQYAVGAAIAAWCATHTCEFVVLLGNNILDNGVTGVNDSQWQDKFELPYASINLPFYPVLGNHDYGGSGAGTELAKGQYQVDYTAVSTKWEMPATHYRLNRAGVDLFAANTTLSLFGTDSAVRTDFASWLPSSTATWKIVLGNHPYRSNGPLGNAGRYHGAPNIPIASGDGVKTFMDERVCGQADVYLAANDDSDQWLTERCGVSSTSAGTELIIAAAGSASETLKTSGTDFNANYFQTTDLGFLYVEIVGRTFTGTFVGTNGGVQFTRSFTK